MKYRISKSIPVPPSKEHSSVYDKIPLEKLPVGGSMCLDSFKISKGDSKKYMAKVAAMRNGIILSGSQRGIVGLQVGVHRPDRKNSPEQREIRVWKKL